MNVLKNYRADVIAASSTGLLNILGAYSFATLIFMGPLSSYLGHGFNLILISNIIGCLIVARFSSFPVLAALTQPPELAIFVLISTNLIANVSDISMAVNPIYTVYAGLVLITILAGILLWLMGKLRLGNMIRFIPFPIVVAFLAASGWVLVIFSINLIIGKPLDELRWDFLGSQTMLQMIFSFSIVFSVILLQRWVKRSIIEPLIYSLSMIAFYMFLYFANISMDDLKETGWYVDIINAAKFANPFEMMSISEIQWAAFLDWHIIGNLLAMLVISPFFLMLTLNGVERETQHEFNYNSELKVVGFANVISLLFGGGAMVNASLSGTLRNHQLGAKTRWVAVFISLYFVVAIIFGVFVLKITPLFIVATIPLMTGVNLLRNWLINIREKLSALDYGLLWLIFLVIAAYGFLSGIIAGFVATLVLFVYRYSRVGIIRNEINGLQLQSNNERGLAAESLLKNVRSEIEIIILQGYIFFGNVNSLIEKIIAKIDKNESLISFIILDFRNVGGMDPSSTESFFRLHNNIKKKNVKIIFSGLAEAQFQNIVSFLQVPSTDNLLLNFPSLDYGLEWCENYLLKQKSPHWNNYFEGQLLVIFPDPQELQLFTGYLMFEKVQAGDVIFSEGALLNKIYFVDAGVLELIRETAGKYIRINTVYPGVFVGENGLYFGIEQAFTCMAKTDSSLYSLSFESLVKMENENPELAIILHRYLVSQTLNRLGHRYQSILALL